MSESKRASSARSASADSAPKPVRGFSSSASGGAACVESKAQSRRKAASGRERRRRIGQNLRRNFQGDVKTGRPTDFITDRTPYQEGFSDEAARPRFVRVDERGRRRP